ncbi:hypothetical protein M407DRAFT_226839 [Tulasnella calospora MUT 4182]|uniref:Uncharacterized protein n=1 Tax=Tulasnella calospora MUT 4182 TaxID=1051891 RepID=A0A0C3QQ91_9AGAM|nr:hypothetical protein M407DRAFT_226839 [Tulasnella calospora MUT 4182]
MLEEDSSEEELVVGDVDGISCTVLDGDSAREEFSSEKSYKTGKQLPTPPNRVCTFDQELPDTSEGEIHCEPLIFHITYETWRKVFRAKFRRLSLRMEGQPPSRIYGYREEDTKQGSNLESHKLGGRASTQAGFPWNGDPVDSRPLPAPICASNVFVHHPVVRSPEKLLQFIDHRPAPTMQGDVEMIVEDEDLSNCPAQHPQRSSSKTSMGIEYVDIVSDIDMGSNEASSHISIPPLVTRIQSNEQVPCPSEPEWARNGLLQQPLSTLAPFPPEPLPINPSWKDCSSMDIDVAEDVEMRIEEPQIDKQADSSTSGRLQAAPNALWSTVIPSPVSRSEQIPGLPPVIAFHRPQEDGPFLHGLQIHLTESSSCAQIQRLPLVRLELAPDIFHPVGREQDFSSGLGIFQPYLAPKLSREDGGDCIPPTASPTPAASSRQPLNRGITSPVNALFADSFDDLPALSFTPSTTGRLTSTGPWDLSLRTPLTSTGPDVSLFPSPGAVSEGNMNNIPDLVAETFLAEAIKESPVITQQTGPVVGIDIGFVNLTGDDFASYEDVAGEKEGEDDSSSDEGWEEIIVPPSLGLNSQQAPLVPPIALTGEELVITLDFEGEENG